MKTGLKLGLKTSQRMALMGRLRMAEWIEMPEKEFAREIEKIEKDSLFQKLYFKDTGSGIIRRQRWPRGRLSESFYEINDQIAAGGQRVHVEEMLGEEAALLPKIQKMGREAFERYFLYGEEAASLDEIARRTGVSRAEVEQINDLLLKIGAEAEFAGPTKASPAIAQSCLARLAIDDGEPSFEFFSPHWARGLYHIRYDLLEEVKRSGNLAESELKRLPHLLKRLETVNLRQNTMFRILESMAKIQAEFLRSGRETLKSPVSLRMLAHRLDLAPSTVSRALSGRCVRLLSGKNIPLIQLVPGRRRVLREILSGWLMEPLDATDAEFVEKLKEEHGIRISRRTVNAVRHEIENAKKGST